MYIDGKNWEIRLKLRLIFLKNKDSEPSSARIKGERVNILKIKELHFLKWPLILVLVFLPYLANAGIFSLALFAKLAGEKEAEAQEVGHYLNSQTVSVLQAAINSDPNKALGGADITIIDDVALLAETGITGSLVEVSERQNTDKISVYEVREGDTLSQIASMFGVSVNTIRWANDFEGPISPGQTLIILPISGITHVVKSGGTIEDVARIYEGDAREIALFNGMSVDDELSPGDEILVPNAVPLEAKESKTSKTSTRVATPAPQLPDTGSAVYSGYYMRPLKTGILSQGLHPSNAVDLAAPAGTPMFAAAPGRVIISKTGGWFGGYGNYIVIEHDNGTQTLYAHNSANVVIAGQRVSQGQLIGYVGSTGNSTGPHVHFEVRGARNPFAY